ncbi:hypothetical protein HYU15_02935 [Candidatus Woesearchaeota archaeon]|nr:hypothetical protein [Candidatus Woesearchaeota archaeon]
MGTITDTVTLERAASGSVEDVVRSLVYELRVRLDTNVAMPGLWQATIQISVGVQGDPSSPIITYRRMSTETGMIDAVTVNGLRDEFAAYRQMAYVLVSGVLKGLGFVESKQSV